MMYTVVATIETATSTIRPPAEWVGADEIEPAKRKLTEQYATTGDTVTFQVVMSR